MFGFSESWGFNGHLNLKPIYVPDEPTKSVIFDFSQKNAS